MPLSVVLLGLLGLAVILASVARIVVIEQGLRARTLMSDAGPADRHRVAA